jgi:hypothetical protein
MKLQRILENNSWKFKKIPKKYKIKKNIKLNSILSVAHYPDEHQIYLRNYLNNKVFIYNKNLDKLEILDVNDNICIKPIFSSSKIKKPKLYLYKFYSNLNGKCIFSCNKQNLNEAWKYFLKKYNYIPTKNYYIYKYV